MSNNEDGLRRVKSADGTETFTLFYGRTPVFSNFHPSPFTIDGNQFVNAEQYFHYKKAFHFGDDEMSTAILASSDPRDHKKLGRKVENYNEEEWNRVGYDYMKEAIRAKFSQNEDLLRDMLATNGTVLVEASPRDRKWGIGLGVHNPKSYDRKQWRGTNLLGQALMEVRDEFMQKSNS